jgi:hypothetical protein
MGDALVAAGDVAGALDNYQKPVAIYEALSAADPTNVRKQHDLAESYAKLGDLDSRLAVKGTTPVNQQSEHWRQARLWYERSLDIWLDLQQRNALLSSEANLPNEFAAKMANCDAALAKLSKAPRP